VLLFSGSHLTWSSPEKQTNKIDIFNKVVHWKYIYYMYHVLPTMFIYNTETCHCMVHTHEVRKETRAEEKEREKRFAKNE